MICKFLPDLAHANRDKVIEAVPKLHGKIVRPIQPDGFRERAGAWRLELASIQYLPACADLIRYQ